MTEYNITIDADDGAVDAMRDLLELYGTSDNTNTLTRDQAVAARASGWIPIDGTTYFIGGLEYLGETGASEIPDLLGLVAVNPQVGHWGVKDWDRATATANAALINIADAVCSAKKAPLAFPSGVLFFTGMLTKTTHWIGEGHGYWPVQPAQSRSGNDLIIDVGNTQLVATGTFPRNMYLPGVSDMASSGATRVNPSARGAGFNDTVYKWPSFMNTDGTLRAVSIAILDTSRGAETSGIRLVPDFGGEDGLDGYNSASSNTRSTADVDIGWVFQHVRGSCYRNISAVGHWRIAGRMIPGVAFWDGVSAIEELVTPYNVTFEDCHFQGYVGTLELGSDTCKVVSVSGSTIRVPWADTLALRAPEVWPYVRYNTDEGWGSSNISPDIVSVVQDGSDPALGIVTFTGTTPLAAGNTLIMRPAGGGNSHIIDNRVKMQGFTFSNGAMAHQSSAVAVGAAFDAPSIAWVSSGHRFTERVMNDPIIQHAEEVAMMVHDSAKISMNNLELERNPALIGSSSQRLIVSPSSSDNTYHPYPCGGTFQFYITSNSNLRFSSIDWGPVIPTNRSGTGFNGAGDVGFFEPNALVFPTYTGTSGWYGAKVQGYVGDIAGIYKPGNPFSAPAWVYDDADETIKGYADINLEAAEFIQTNGDGNSTISTLENTADGISVSWVSKTRNRTWTERLSDTSAEVTYSFGGVEVGKYEGGSTETGWHFNKAFIDENLEVDGDIVPNPLKGLIPKVFATRADLVTWRGTSGTPKPGQIVSAGGYDYLYMPIGHALYGTNPIADLAGYVWHGERAVEHLGASPLTEAALIARAGSVSDVIVANDASFARAYTLGGVWHSKGQFYVCSAGINLPEGGGFDGAGFGYWDPIFPANDKTWTGTTLLFKGTGTRNKTIDYVSSIPSGGGWRTDPDGGDPIKLWSARNTNASGATASTPKQLSVAVMGTGQAPVLRNMRVTNWSGTNGIEGHSNQSGGLGDSWDIGVMLLEAPQAVVDSVQVVGDWREIGLAVMVGAGAEKMQISNVIAQGLRGMCIRGFDRYYVNSTTSSTVVIPWSNEHYWGPTGSFRGSDSVVYTYTGLTYAAGSPGTLTFTGVTPNPTGIFHVRHSSVGVANSVVRDAWSFGLDHVSGSLSTALGLAPSTALEISGYSLRGLLMDNFKTHTRERVVANIGDASDLTFDSPQFEGGGHVVALPQAANPCAFETRNLRMTNDDGLAENDLRLFNPRSGLIDGLQLSPRSAISRDLLIRPMSLDRKVKLQTFDGVDMLNLDAVNYTTSFRYVAVPTTFPTAVFKYQRVGDVVFGMFDLSWTGLDTADTSVLSLYLPVWSGKTIAAIFGNVHPASTGFSSATPTNTIAPALAADGVSCGIRDGLTTVLYNNARLSASGTLKMAVQIWLQ